MTPGQRAATALGGGALAGAVSLVVYFEGTRFDPYDDSLGVITVCTGHTRNVEPRRYTSAECRELLDDDLREAEAGLQGCATRPMPQHVHDAFLSFTFNVGAPKACASTLMRKWNAGDAAGACAELSRWTLGNGKQMPGLVKRRAAERALCEGRPVSLGAQG